MNVVKVNVQVPVEEQIRDKAARNAKSLGFGSLQDVVRVFLYSLAKSKVEVDLTTTNKFDSERLPKEMEDRILEIEAKGDYVGPMDMDDFLYDLNKDIDESASNKRVQKATRKASAKSAK
jgi:hypothetical protein